MATLTYDPSDGQPEFNEQELAAIEVGERMQAEQEQVYAGKFRDAQELEKAYIELQKKLGSNDTTKTLLQEEVSDTNSTEEGGEGSDGEETADDAAGSSADSPSAAASLINDASAYFAENGQLSEEMIEAFSEISSADLVSAYIESQGNIPQAETPDLTQNEVTQIKNQVGGEQQYEQLMGWAAENIDSSIVEAYDSLVDSGNAAAIALALRGISAEYENSVGYEGRMLTGKSAPSPDDTFRSQAEVVQAMQDPRYDRDPAYRDDVFRKLERSNVNF